MNLTLFLEAFLLLTATFWTQFAGIRLASALAPVPALAGTGFLAGVALAAVSIVLFWLGNSISLLRGMRRLVETQMAPILSDLRFVDLLVIAAVSGFCEEVLFRGVIQAQLGLVASSFIFGLFHCPGFRHISYAIWAFAAGLVLGLLYQASGNLWTAICAHAASNAVALIFIRYRVKVAESDESEQ